VDFSGLHSPVHEPISALATLFAWTSGLGYFEDSKDDGRSLQRRAACSGVTVCVASDGLS
jgi:hypothetical protein